METIRAFLAVELADDIRKQMADAQERLAYAGANVKWVRTGSMHLTLWFYRALEQRALLPLTTQLRTVTDALAPFDITVEGVGRFGSARSPRIVWAGISHGTDRLERLHAMVSQAMRQCGLAAEERPFKPHLTLGRVRNSRNAGELAARVEKMASTRFGTMTVESLALIRSNLTPSGPEYTSLDTFLLGSGKPS